MTLNSENKAKVVLESLFYVTYTQDVWLGLRRKDSATGNDTVADYIWSDGSDVTFDEFDSEMSSLYRFLGAKFGLFSDGYPYSENGRYPCVYADINYPGMKWQNTNCGKYLEFACEMPEQGEPPTTAALPTKPPFKLCPYSKEPFNIWVVDQYSDNQDYCYHFSMFMRSWDAAKSYCEFLKGRLVSITNKTENDFVMDAAQADAWIGLSRVNGQFEWVDGSDSKYMNWAEGGNSIVM